MRLNPVLLILSAFFVATSHAAVPSIWDIELLDAKVEQIEHGEHYSFYNSLKQQADQILKDSHNPSVMDKVETAQSGDKHDYMSLSRYWWPNPKSKDGLPYVRRDGDSNPEIRSYDRASLSGMSNSVVTLSLVYYISGDERYANKAIERLNTWFVDKKTRMNPNLNFAQIRKGHDADRGTPFGILDGYSFVEMLDAVTLLERRGVMPASVREALHNWFGEYIDWMLTSKQGVVDSQGDNNHAVAYDVQLVRYAIYGNRDSLAREVIKSFSERRLSKQIDSDGRMSEELKRTRAFFYSRYNLEHMIDICDMAKSLGVNDLYYSSNGAIDRAIGWLIPYAQSPNTFPYKQISSWESARRDFARLLYRASKYSPNAKEYEEIYHELRSPRDNSIFSFLQM